MFFYLPLAFLLRWGLCVGADGRDKQREDLSSPSTTHVSPLMWQKDKENASGPL